MKSRTFLLLAGFGGPLLLAEPATAAFQGITIETKANEFGIGVCNVLAAFDNPLDHMVAVAGTPNNPLNISVVNGTFYQHQAGSDLAPIPGLIGIFPSLAFDTFVTIGRKTSEGDFTTLPPLWPGFDSSTLSGTNLGWFVTPANPQGAPDVSGKVLIGQFSTTNGSVIQGEFLVQVISDGSSITVASGFTHVIPAPSSMFLLVIAGLRTRRRRC